MTKYARSDVPDEYFKLHNKFNRLAGEAFYKGMNLKNIPHKIGVDRVDAVREIKETLSDWDYEHNLKLAIVAMLFDKYFIFEDEVKVKQQHKKPKKSKKSRPLPLIESQQPVQPLPSMKNQLKEFFPA